MAASLAENPPPIDLQREMYRRMLFIRHFDEAATKLLGRGEISGALHTSIGQEAEVVGACMALREDDFMVGNHRSHGHPIGKGAKVGPLMAELLGRATGVNKGKGGSMHLSDFSVGSLGETSIVGSGLPVATGAGLGCKLKGSDQVSLCFFGDGASNEGTFHESLNLAAIWGLPVVYLCENNGYGELTAASRVVAVKDIATRSVAYAMPGEVVDGQEVLSVYAATRAAVDRARAGGGPSLIEAKTYRYDNHAALLPIENYRSREEVEEWRKRDPIQIHRTCLVGAGVSEADLQKIEEDAQSAIDEAVQFARNSPYPEPESAYEHVYSHPIRIERA
jgi:acetoin:2,6-dichlorophenolindophenol oxidoreductase subunit alpha